MGRTVEISDSDLRVVFNQDGSVTQIVSGSGVDSGLVTSTKNTVSGLYFNKAWVGTQAQYDAIAVKDANTQYNIVAA